MSTVVINSPATVTGPEGPDDAALAAKVDASNGVTTPTPEPAKPERPGWLPEKFQSPEDLAKAYAELESKLGKAPAAEATPAATDAEVKTAVESAGLDFDALGNEIAQNGALSAESRAALVKAGIPEAVIDSHVAGVTAVAQAEVAKAYAVVGGEESFKAIASWAADNATAAQAETYNALLEAGKLAQALDYLNTAYVAANGKAPQAVIAGRGNAGAGTGESYASRQELTADMANPLYARDPAFRAKVEAKLARSSIF